MKEAVKGVLVIIGILVVSLLITSSIRYIVSSTASSPRKEITKEEYIEKVRQNNPSDPEFYACIYSNMIDQRGITEVKRFDITYAGKDYAEVPPEVINMVSSAAEGCN